MGGDPPRTKTIFIRVHRTKICKGQVGDKSPPKGVNSKKCPTPKNLNAIFSSYNQQIFLISENKGVSRYYDLKAKNFELTMRKRYHRKKNKKNSLWGAWPPNLTPDRHIPQNLSRALLGADDPEKISEIARTVAEKIEFEKKLAPPGGQTGSNLVT